MSSPHACRPRWLWLSVRIRCALTPDDPQLIAQYLCLGHRLVCSGQLPGWSTARRELCLLMDTAADPLLPQHWRETCADHAGRALAELDAHAGSQPHRHAELRHWRSRLARLDLHTTLPIDEAAPGAPSTDHP
ncbi:MAG: hypothetical protein RLY78_3349 [Pseudomonadota bacterium]|jgi:hypothetical protein|uniref:Uncharacterized protein n=1 Tax=Pseudaquabacterium rugosum TaxID=2984194 RepID=A0ABU9BAS2_9BURK